MSNQYGISNSNYRNGYSTGKRNKLYTKYYAMMNRCYNINDKSFFNYGGRGIRVYDDWIDSFELYKKYVESIDNYNSTYSLDRIDNDGNYKPGNLRWTDRSSQNINRRKRKDNSSGFTGVQLKNGKYKSDIMFNKKRHHLGFFNTISDAINARNNYIIENNLPHKIQDL